MYSWKEYQFERRAMLDLSRSEKSLIVVGSSFLFDFLGNEFRLTASWISHFSSSFSFLLRSGSGVVRL